jgi:phosphate starvation-inducible PhoH-like protein
LHKINKIAFATFTASDVVRHPVVAEIIQAYDEAEIREVK